MSKPISMTGHIANAPYKVRKHKMLDRKYAVVNKIDYPLHVGTRAECKRVKEKWEMEYATWLMQKD
jgi:hypothetical protein